MAYQLEKKALNKISTISPTDYVALIRNVEKQKNAGNVLITWTDLLTEVGMDLTYISSLTTDSLEVAGPLTVSQSPANIGGGGAIPLTNMFVFINTVAPEAYTLAAGTIGQYITLIMRTDGGNATITPSILRGYTTITLNDVGDSVTLWYDGAVWNTVCQVANAVLNP